MSKSPAKRKPNATLRWVLMLVGVAVVFGGVFAIKAFFAKQTNNFFDNMPQPAVAVSSYVAKTQRWTDNGEAVGTFVAINGTDITTEAGGVVRAIEFQPGQRVSAGTVLFRLNAANEEATLAALETSAKLANVQAERWQKLGKDKLVSLDDVQQRVAAAASARAQVEAQRALIAQKTIRAPFSGVLGLRQVSPGALVTPGVAIATLDDLSRVYVDFPLPEAQLSRVAVGRRINGRATAYPERAFDGAVTTIDARLDPATRAVQVRADFANGERMLRPGMLMTVEVPGVERQALLLPEIAVTQIGRDSFVFRAKPDDSVEQVKVTVAARRSGKVEIADGLATGDRIVVEGTGKLRAGGKISEGGPAAKDAASPAQPAASTKG